MPTIRHDGSALYYEEYGAGPPLVFVHGQAGNTLVWWQQIPAFAPDYRCIVLDLPGWGRSLDARSGSGPRLPDIVAALGRVLDAAGVGTCAIVAHSLGGVVANAFCLAHPERVRAAVLNGSTGGVVPPSMQALKGEIDRDAGALTEAWRAGHGPHPGVSARLYREQPALARLYEMIAGLNRPDTLDPTRIPTMDRLAVPAHTLFLYGDEDPFCPPGFVEAAAAARPESTVAVIPASGHSPYFEHAAPFNTIVRHFLDVHYGESLD